MQKLTMAKTEEFDLGLYKANNSFVVKYHSVVFEELNPNTTYAYRLVMEIIGQNGFNLKQLMLITTQLNLYILEMHKMMILSHWSRVIRMAYQTAPNASFVIHAGDMVDTAHRDYEWAQWFKAGGFIHRQWTTIPVVGNHEFQSTKQVQPKKEYQFNGDHNLLYLLKKG